MKTLLPLLMALLLSAGAAAAETVQLAGRTMGTTYHITIADATAHTDRQALKADIDRCLKTVNASMSTYDPESEISRFNRLVDVGKPFAVSTDFYTVMVLSRRLHRISGGAWDGTVGPLVTLWGFGSRKNKPAVPADTAIQRLLADTGFQWIRLAPPASLIKQKASLAVDLASVAKGFGVDKVGRLLVDRGSANFLVEIGGEVYAAGVRSDGKQWRVGINRPVRGASADDLYAALSLQDRALATSGDYRQFFTEKGRVYSHILDPRTGYPVENGVVSVSVVADTCMLADGLATAGMVLGPQGIIALVEKMPEADCLAITREKGGSLKSHRSSGFGQYLQ